MRLSAKKVLALELGLGYQLGDDHAASEKKERGSRSAARSYIPLQGSPGRESLPAWSVLPDGAVFR